MYQININLLNDRPEYASTAASSKGTIPGDSKMPLVWGGAVAAGLIGVTLLSFGGASLFGQQLVNREQSLDSDLSKLAPELSKINELQAKEQAVQAETAALAKVFNQIKPWSATLQDLRDRVPPTLQITRIEQVAPPPPPAGQPAPSPSPSPSPSPNASPSPSDSGTAPATPATAVPPPMGSELKIAGNTLNYSDINDFELTLRKSAFLKSDKTQLVSSQRENNTQTGVNLIKYEMRTQLNDVPASELLQVLNAKGATGLVSRIESLKRQGVTP